MEIPSTLLQKASAKLVSPMQSFTSSIEPSIVSSTAQENLKPYKTNQIENNKDSSHGNFTARESNVYDQTWLDKDVRDHILNGGAKSSIEKQNTLIDFDDYKDDQRDPNIGARSQQEKSIPILQTVSLNKILTPMQAGPNLSLHTNDKENMPLVTYSVSPRLPSTIFKVDCPPSLEFDQSGFGDSKNPKPRPSTPHFGYESAPKGVASTPSLQTDATAFIKAFASKRPSFTSKWSTPSKPPSP